MRGVFQHLPPPAREPGQRDTGRMTLAEFIGARLDEDEAAARAAPGVHWTATEGDSIAGAAVYDEQWRLLDPAHYNHDNALSTRPGATGPQYIERARDELAAHIARHDPARVLREVEAKRKILAEVVPAIEAMDMQIINEYGTSQDEPDAHWPLLRIMAVVWSDHPDYDPEMAP